MRVARLSQVVPSCVPPSWGGKGTLWSREVTCLWFNPRSVLLLGPYLTFVESARLFHKRAATSLFLRHAISRQVNAWLALSIWLNRDGTILLANMALPHGILLFRSFQLAMRTLRLSFFCFRNWNSLNWLSSWGTPREAMIHSPS